MKKLLAYVLFVLLGGNTVFSQVQTRPNIVLILADDMGYSDLGCFGSEINTPNLDTMAKDGVKMTNFYNASRCCPSRASLLTGVYPHQAGVGDMMNTRPYPSYQGYLNRQTVTLAEVLQQVGYGTYMSGKWHVGQAKENWPLQRGFDRYYGLIDGANSYFENRSYRPKQTLTIALDNEEITPPIAYYSTDAYTDYALEFINQHVEKRNNDPFFMYIAYQAPHWPLHALPEDIAKYKGKYMEGWESVRQKRFDKQMELGLFPTGTTLPVIDENIRKWADCSWEEKVKWDEQMAVYAAMVDRVDQNVGKIKKRLQEMGELENTIFIFLSDNGASSETIANAGFTPEILAANDFPASHPQSFTAYGLEGALVSNTPFRKYKHWEFEGGNATSFIAYGPQFIQKGVSLENPSHLVDIMPTLVEYAGAKYPQKYKDNTIQAMEGTSLVSFWKGKGKEKERAICFEHEGNKAVRKGKWKIVAEYPQNEWFLYDLSSDRAEQVDLNDKYPAVLKEMVTIYNTWADRVGVIPYEQLDTKRVNERYN
jgi:arylsulfatase A-like enzyme